MLLVTRADLLKNRLSLIVRVNVVLNRTVVVASDWRFDNLCGSHLQSQSDLYHVSWWYYTLVIDLIGQLRRDVIGRLSSVKPWCYWLWRLVISNWCVSIRLLSQLNSRLLLVNNNRRLCNCGNRRIETHQLLITSLHSQFYIVQNLFHQGKGSRSISLNSHYLVLFKNPRDKLLILTLAKQMYPGKTDFLLNQYEEAVKRPFGYLLIDLKTTTQDSCRLRTNVTFKGFFADRTEPTHVNSSGAKCRLKNSSVMWIVLPY